MSGVVFRRINGRIIPIKNKSSETKKGAAEIAGGGAVAAGAGLGASAMVKKALDLSHRSKNEFRIANQNFRAATGMNIKAGTFANPNLAKGAAKTIRSAVGKRFVGKQLFRARNPVLHAGAAVAALLIGHGTNRIVDAHKKDKSPNYGAIGKAVGITAGVATYGAYYRGLGFKKPVELVANVISKFRKVPSPFRKYGPGKGV